MNIITIKSSKKLSIEGDRMKPEYNKSKLSRSALVDFLLDEALPVEMKLCYRGALFVFRTYEERLTFVWGLELGLDEEGTEYEGGEPVPSDLTPEGSWTVTPDGSYRWVNA